MATMLAMAGMSERMANSATPPATIEMSS